MAKEIKIQILESASLADVKKIFGRGAKVGDQFTTTDEEVKDLVEGTDYKIVEEEGGFKAPVLAADAYGLDGVPYGVRGLKVGTVIELVGDFIDVNENFHYTGIKVLRDGVAQDRPMSIRTLVSGAFDTGRNWEGSLTDAIRLTGNYADRRAQAEAFLAVLAEKKSRKLKIVARRSEDFNGRQVFSYAFQCVA